MRKVGFTLVLLALICTSCNTGNKFASSFSKRKYTKGYFMDVPATVNRVIAGNLLYASKPHAITATAKPVEVKTASPTAPQTIIKPPAREVKKLVSSEPIVLKTATTLVPADSTHHSNYNDNSKEYNYTAAIGCAIAIAGIVMTVINGFFTILAIILLVIGNALCVYSFFSDKIYWTWLAIIGLSLTIILFTLIFL